MELIGDLQYLKSFIAAFHIGNNGHPSPYPTEVWWSFAPAEAERCPKMPPVFSRAIHGPQKNLRTCWETANADDFTLGFLIYQDCFHGKRHGLRWQVLFFCWPRGEVGEAEDQQLEHCIGKEEGTLSDLDAPKK